MKTLVMILMLCAKFYTYAQNDAITGNYTQKLGNQEALFEYHLTLNPDHTFLFHYHSNIKNGIPQEKTYYGKGNWKVEKDVVIFLSDKQTDIDEKHTLDFTNSKARFIVKSARDKSDKVVDTRLQFLASNIFWLARIALVKA